MKKVLLTSILLIIFAKAFALTGDVNSESENTITYCKQTGGSLVKLQAQFNYGSGESDYDPGLIKQFCRYDLNGNIAILGLDTLSDSPNLAATYVKKLKLDKNRVLPSKPYSNPASNICLKLRGTEINFIDSYSAGGGFNVDNVGQVGLCVFGDGSAITSWTLVYVAYKTRPDIKNLIRANPLEHLIVPDIYD